MGGFAVTVTARPSVLVLLELFELLVHSWLPLFLCKSKILLRTLAVSAKAENGTNLFPPNNNEKRPSEHPASFVYNDI